MKTKRIYIYLISLALLPLATCTKHEYSANDCFSDNVLPIFVSNCTMSECHNSKDKEEGYDLSNYDGIMKGVVPKHPSRSEVYQQIKGSHPSMPPVPYPKLSKAQVHTIEVWIKNGALNTSNCGTCDTTNYTYSNRVNPILQSWCVGCHNSNNKGGGFDLSNYSGVVAAIPGNKLVGSIEHLSGFWPMPKNGNQLSACDINAISTWVTSGYPNN